MSFITMQKKTISVNGSMNILDTWELNILHKKIPPGGNLPGPPRGAPRGPPLKPPRPRIIPLPGGIPIAPLECNN